MIRKALVGVNIEGTGAGLPRRGLHQRRQDRHGPGDRDRAKPEVQRLATGRTPPRPRAVHGLRAGRGPKDRARNGGGERRFRRRQLGADRAPRVRLLADEPVPQRRKTSRPCRKARPRPPIGKPRNATRWPATRRQQCRSRRGSRCKHRQRPVPSWQPWQQARAGWIGRRREAERRRISCRRGHEAQGSGFWWRSSPQSPRLGHRPPSSPRRQSRRHRLHRWPRRQRHLHRLQVAQAPPRSRRRSLPPERPEKKAPARPAWASARRPAAARASRPFTARCPAPGRTAPTACRRT